MTETAEKKKVSMIPAKPQYDRSVKLAENYEQRVKDMDDFLSGNRWQSIFGICC